MARDGTRSAETINRIEHLGAARTQMLQPSEFHRPTSSRPRVKPCNGQRAARLLAQEISGST